jgi:uncharacterized protein (DUF58 family)
MKVDLKKLFKNFFNFKYRASINRTFIFPNLYGFLFGGISFVLLLMAMGYSNNLLYFYVFFLISVAVTGMWTTNKNVERVFFESLTSDWIFANEKNTLKLNCGLKTVNKFSIRNWAPAKSSYQIELLCFDKTSAPQQSVVCNLIDGKTQIALSYSPDKRGRRSLPRIEVQSSFPFSMLRAWKYFHENQDVIIYPQRKGSSELPPIGDLSEDEKKMLQSDQQNEDHTGLFSHHREFQNNDSVYRIDWKRSAKFDKLFIKKFEDDRTQKQVLSWGMTHKLRSTEDKISQLALWVELCEAGSIQYRLLLPKNKTDFGSGPTHYKRCMELLALLEESYVS